MRVKWIDSAKGLGILLVVWGHTFIPMLPEKIVYSFHMPLFFFLAGCVTNSAISTTLRIRKRLRGLIVPFIVLGAVSYGFWFVTNKVIGYTSNADPQRAMLSIFWPMGRDYSVYGALWFLPCLFAVELVFMVLNKADINLYVKLALLAMSAVIGSFYLPLVHIRLPLFVDVGFAGIVFYALGYSFCKYDKTGLVLDKRWYYVIPLFFVVNFVAAYFNCKPSMAGLKFGNFWLFYLGAISGIGWVVMCCRKIGGNKALTFLGQNTLIILGLHIIVFNVVDTGATMIFHTKYMELQGSLVAGIVYTATIIITLIPAIFVVNRFCPWVVGKRVVVR